MNERIQELDKQAYQWAVNESKGGPNICAPGSDYFLAMEKKKFAELIVKECRKVIADDIDDNSDDDFDLGLDHARQIIGEHFGVEE
jgi:hypothetical protein